MRIKYKFPATFLRYEKRTSTVRQWKSPDGQVHSEVRELGWFMVIKIGDAISSHFISHDPPSPDEQECFQPGQFWVIFDKGPESERGSTVPVLPSAPEAP